MKENEQYRITLASSVEITLRRRKEGRWSYRVRIEQEPSDVFQAPNRESAQEAALQLAAAQLRQALGQITAALITCGRKHEK